MGNKENDFFAFTDSLIGSSKAVAKEELDSNSSTDEFIESVAQAAANFIQKNRNAFDLDDAKAITELAQVLTVETVVSRIVELLAAPAEEVPAKQVDDVTVAQTAEKPASAGDDEFVSEDVMKILDE